MNFDKIDGSRIFRPRSTTESIVFSAEAQFIQSHVKPGTYTSKEEINSIIQKFFTFHKGNLEECLEKLATRSYLTFLLWQYDESHKALQAARSGKLNPEIAEKWLNDSPNIRRAFKYLIERTCSLNLAAPEIENKEELTYISECAQIASEEFVRLSTQSDSTFSLFPDETELIITASGPDIFSMHVTNDKFNELQQRNKVDGKFRHKFLGDERGLPFEHDKTAQDKYLGDAFEKAHGIRYSRAIEVIGTLIEFENPANKNAFDGCFYNKAEIIQMLAEHVQISQETLEIIFAGFSIKPEIIVEKPGQPWNPKRSYGATRRGLFEVPHQDGTCLAWSRMMVKEALFALMEGAVFQKFPDEWTTPEIKTALTKLHKVRGDWFEEKTIDNLGTLGYKGRSWSQKIGSIKIPDEVGEIDYLGYNADEKRLLIGECKMTLYNTEPKLWRDDLDRYVEGEKSYFNKYRKKRDWILQNLDRVCNEIAHVSKQDIKPKNVSTAMITNYPNIASCFTDDFPCISLTELMLSMEQQKGWPYDIGTIPVDDNAESE